MADWSPLAEGDPLPGDPFGLADLIGLLRDEALGIDETADQLRAIDAGATWSGEAASAFTQQRQLLAPDLDLVASRIEAAIRALDAFGRSLDTAQAEGRRAVFQARDSEERITRARLGLEDMARQAADPQLAAPRRAAQFPDLPPPAPEAYWGPNWPGEL